LPSGYIKGSTGAGDAFCAGSLVGIYKGWSDKEILEFGSLSAAASLREADAVSGMTNEKEIKELANIYPRKK
jgi:sugar/nucleoside kinase (ribokinase family)